MSQFSGSKNPPWARPQSVNDFTAVTAATSIAATLTQSQVANPIMQQPQVQQVTPAMYGIANTTQNVSVVQPQQYTTQQLLGLQAQQQAAAALQQQQQQQQQAQVIPQPGIAIPTTLATTQVATVSYPAPRAAQQTNQPKQRVFTGTITKLHDNFGFVDEDVFFQTSCVKGSVPKVNDRVLVEASFNANMPFKWNATRIQVLPNQGSQANQQGFSKPGFSVQQGNQINTFTSQTGPQPLMPQGFADNILGRSGGTARRNDRFDRERDRKRDRDRRDRMDRAAANRKRSRSKSPQKRSENNTHQRSPARRRPIIVPRYVVQVPKLSFDMKEANVISLKSRYSNMYIPSDFFNASFSWTEAFPCYRPFQMGNHCGFHVMHKDVEALNPNDAILDPPDADHLYSAKVMLMSCPSLEDLYHKSCSLAEDPADVRESFVHPTRLIHFLVGLKGKNETMAIGGPWSPSMDGPNPAEDPQVLIRTAIRTTKALTGVDLTGCTQWYQYAEVRYLRQEETHKGKMVPARVETTVIFLPDVWSCNPTRLEWATLQGAYKKQLQKKVASVSKDGSKESNSQEEEECEGDITLEIKEPTHYSELDPKTMKILDLRKELECRSVSSKGLKSQLIARLTKALKTEQEKEEEQEAMEVQPATEISEEAKKNLETEEKSDEKKKEQEEEKKKKEEREKASLERKYAVPENPVIIVHPSPTAKSGKFDCSLMSLSVLLDYRPEDNKEHSFEVSLFAELFNEMLMRDYGFEIYKSLFKAPEKKEEEKKDKGDKSSKDGSSSAKKKKTDEKDKDGNKKEKESKDKDKKKDKDEDKKDGEKKEDEEEEEEEGKRDRDKEKKREKKKYMTKDAALLLAFTYFDQNHTGYLLDKDVEEIIHSIGLQLSRAQVKKLVQKLVTRDALNYRKLTDRPVVTPGEKPTEKEEVIEEKEIKYADIVKLSKGNSDYLQQARKGEPVDLKMEKKSPKSKDGAHETGPQMINYKGAMLDIESLMSRLERSEKSRTEMEKQMMDICKEKDQLRKSVDSKEEKSEKLQTELKNLKQKLLVQEKITNNSESTSKRYLSALMESKEHLNAMLTSVTNALGEGEKAEESKKEIDSNGTV